MLKYFLLFLNLTLTLSLCPRLKPNSNVIVSCSTNQAAQFNCDSKDSEIPGGTIAVYKCEKYFKPVNNRAHKNGTLNCTDAGSWTNKRTFQNFRCEADCGKQPSLYNELISQGNSTKAKHWPWVVTFFRQTKEGHFKYSCGGTLIGQKTILTAAHCVADAHSDRLPAGIFRVFVGTFSGKFQENLQQNGVQMYLIKEIHIHPDYRFNSLSSDIAIIVLNKKVTLTNSVLPICLPRTYEHDALAIGSGKPGEIASFGIDGTGLPAQVLQHAYIPVQTSSKCNDVINVIPHGDQFCGGDPIGPKICRGDSGSGLVFKSIVFNEEKYSLHGIVSNTGEVSNGCAPMVIFTKVFSHISWIQENLIISENLHYLRAPNRASNSGPYTSAEKRALAKLRPMVKSILQEDYMQSDKYLVRFLRTKQLNVKETKELIQSVMQWRKEVNINAILNEDFTQLRKDFPFFLDGFDKDGRPALMILWDLSKITPSTYEKFRRYYIRTFEELEVRSIGTTKNISGIVLIVDLNGLDNKQLCAFCLRIWTGFAQIYEQYYSQMIYGQYLLNAPPIADRVMDIFAAFMSEYAIQTMHPFGPNKTEWSAALLKQIPADQLFIAFGGTRSIKKGTKRIQLAV